MRIALLTATALDAFSSLAVAQNQVSTTTSPKSNDAIDSAMPKVRINVPDVRLRWMVDPTCRGPGVEYSEGACVPPPPPYKPRP